MRERFDGLQRVFAAIEDGCHRLVLVLLEVDRQQLYPAPSGFRGIVPKLAGMLEAEVLFQQRRNQVQVQGLDAQTRADVFSLRLTGDEPSPNAP